MAEIRLSRLWIMDWPTREVRMYEDGDSLTMQAVTREVKSENPFRETDEHFAYAVILGVPPLPRAWYSVALFGQDYEDPHRPWFAAPKVELNIEPKQWRTVGAKIDGAHLYYGVDDPPDAGRIPLADRWKKED